MRLLFPVPVAILAFLLAMPAHAQVVINEFLPLPDSASANPNQTHQWVELFNKGSQPVDMTGWRLTDRDGAAGTKTKALPAVTIPAGGFLVVHIAAGQNVLTFGAQGAHVYTGDAAGTVLWNGNRDDIGLYAPQGIRDYLTWAGRVAAFAAGQAHSDAVAAGIWTQGDFLNRNRIQAAIGDRYRSFSTGDSVGRNNAALDTNLPTDFDAHGGTNSWTASPGQANDVPFPRPGRAAVQVNPARAAGETAEWTVLYYLLAENSLEASIQGNLKEIMDNAGASPSVNHVALIDTRKNRPLYGRVDSNFYANATEYPESNLGEAKALRDFIQRAKTEFPARKYALVLAAHGDSWKGFGPDESHKGTRGDSDDLFMEEFSTALAFQQFELIAFDSCMMAGIEVAYQIRNAARYLVASEEVVPGPGLNYPAFVSELAANPGWDGRQLGTRMVTSFVEKYQQTETQWTMSLIDLAQTPQLTLAVDEWARVMHKYLNIHNGRGDPKDNVQRAISESMFAAQRFHDRNFVDLTQFAELVRDHKDANCVKPPIARVLAARDAAVIMVRNGSDNRGAGGIHVHFPIYRSRTNAANTALEYDSYDHPATRILSGDTSYAAYGPNNYFLPGSLRDYETGEPFAVIDRVNGVDIPQTLRPPQDFAAISTPGFLFVRDTYWDEFIDRYYHPVAEARAIPGTALTIIPLGGGSCQNVIDLVIAPVGTGATFSASGSSDDEKLTPTYFFWDADAEEECAADCVAPHRVSPPGRPAHDATDNIDADRNLDDTKFDDVNGREQIFQRSCPAAEKQYVVTLHTWDEDHLKVFHDTRPSAEYVHPQSDTYIGIVQCMGSATNFGTSAQAPFTQTGERVLLDVGLFNSTGARIPYATMGVLATNLTNVSVRDTTEMPSSNIGRNAGVEAMRAADVSVTTGVLTNVVTNKQGYATIDFTFGTPGAASLQFTIPGLPTATLPYTVVARLAPPADDIILIPPTGPLTVGQDATLQVDVRRAGAPLVDAVVSFTNPPGSSGTAELRNGTLFRTNFGSQSRTGQTGRTNVVFRPVANGPVEIMVISGAVVRVVSMTATGGPARAADRIQVADAPAFGRVNQEVTVRWRAKALEAPVANAAVQVEDQAGSIRRSATSSVQTDANGFATFRFTPFAVGIVRLNATTSGVVLGAPISIPVLPEAPAQGPVTVVSALNNGPSGDPKISPGGLFSVYGQNLATGTLLTSTTPWPRTMADARVTINGIDAPLYYVSPTQINGQIPYETAVGNATAVISVTGQDPVSVTFPVIAAKPGVLLFNGNRGVVVNQNGSVNTSATPAAGGEIGIVYFSGLGIPDQAVATGAGAPATEPLARAKYPNSITINGGPVEVFYLGLAPTYPALAQANFRFPSLPPGDYPLVITVNGEASNPGLITIR